MAKNKASRKVIRKQIEQQLFATFDHLKDDANPKKLRRSIRRASKILSAGIKPEGKTKKSKDTKAKVNSPEEAVTSESIAN